MYVCICISPLAHPVHGCNWCCSCARHGRCVSGGVDSDPVNVWLDYARSGDGIIIASPTRCGNVTTEVKSFIDRIGVMCYHNHALMKDKVGAAVVASNRSGGGQTTVEAVCFTLHPPYSHIFLFILRSNTSSPMLT